MKSMFDIDLEIVNWLETQEAEKGKTELTVCLVLLVVCFTVFCGMMTKVHAVSPATASPVLCSLKAAGRVH